MWEVKPGVVARPAVPARSHTRTPLPRGDKIGNLRVNSRGKTCMADIGVSRRMSAKRGDRCETFGKASVTATCEPIKQCT